MHVPPTESIPRLPPLLLPAALPPSTHLLLELHVLRRQRGRHARGTRLRAVQPAAQRRRHEPRRLQAAAARVAGQAHSACSDTGFRSCANHVSTTATEALSRAAGSGANDTAAGAGGGSAAVRQRRCLAAVPDSRAPAPPTAPVCRCTSRRCEWPAGAARLPPVLEEELRAVARGAEVGTAAAAAAAAASAAGAGRPAACLHLHHAAARVAGGLQGPGSHGGAREGAPAEVVRRLVFGTEAGTDQARGSQPVLSAGAHNAGRAPQCE